VFGDDLVEVLGREVIEVVDDEAVAGEEDGLGVTAKELADEEERGWWDPEFAGRDVGAVEAAAVGASCLRSWFAVLVVGALDEGAAVVDVRWASAFRDEARRSEYGIAAISSAPSNLFPGGYEVGILEDTETKFRRYIC
jgi:hypothetical protein